MYRNHLNQTHRCKLNRLEPLDKYLHKHNHFTDGNILSLNTKLLPLGQTHDKKLNTMIPYSKMPHSKCQLQNQLYHCSLHLKMFRENFFFEVQISNAFCIEHIWRASLHYGCYTESITMTTCSQKRAHKTSFKKDDLPLTPPKCVAL